MQDRGKRLSGHRWIMLMTASGPQSVHILNLSGSGLLFAGGTGLAAGEAVGVPVGGGRLDGRVVRRDARGGAISFARGLSDAELAAFRS